MEALAALGIACNLMQVISFTGEIITLCKHTYKRGSADQGLEGNTKTLHVLIQSLEESLHESTAQSAPDPATVELQVLARKCLDAVTSLSTELNKIGIYGSQGSVRRTIIAVSKRLSKAGDLRRLQQEIDGYQKILESGLLVRICTANEAAKIQSREEFRSLSTTLQHFIDGLSKSQVHASQLILSIDKRIENGFLSIQDAATQRRVLWSLKYEGMNDRRNAIKEHHRKTFEWIFRGQVPIPDPEDADSSIYGSDTLSDHSITWSDIHGGSPTSPRSIAEMFDEAGRSHHSEDNTKHPWDDFVTWLQSEDKVYWVSGKPGSGKSTLMLFLLHDARTQASLNLCRPNTLIISHFLLCSGQLLQRSIRGIYFSLLHQLLEEDLGDKAFLLSLLAQKVPRVLFKDSPGDWADRELKRALQVVLENSTRPTCLFIDGLDELVSFEIENDLWSFLGSLQSIKKLKICLSSRPGPTFQMRLGKVPKLGIHTLTQGDIRTYATDFLKSKILLDRGITTGLEQEHFVNRICEMSNGVFLWVHLVLRRLQRGHTNKDSISVLNERLGQMPEELNDLFSDMWSRLGQDVELSDYISTAATYFRLVDTPSIRTGPLILNSKGVITVVDMMLATDRRFLKSIMDGRDISPGQIEKACETVLANLETRCAGLLECREIDLYCVPRTSCKFTAQTRYHRLQIQFIHRSALEFLVSTPEGSKILAHDTSTSEVRQALLCRVDLAVARLWGFMITLIEPCSRPTITEFLGLLSGYGDVEDTYSLSKNVSRSLTSLGGLIYTDARFNEDDFLPFYTRLRYSNFIGRNSPDFIMVLSQSLSVGLVPSYLESLDSELTPDYRGYLIICMCENFKSRSFDSLQLANGKGPTDGFGLDLESGIKYLIQHGANLNVKGLSSLSFQQLTLDDLRSSYAQLDTSACMVIRQLYGRFEKNSLLRIVSTFITSGAQLNQEMVFSIRGRWRDNSAGLFLGISKNAEDMPGNMGWYVTFATTPEYLLELALSQILKHERYKPWESILKTLISGRMNLEGVPSNPDPPEPLAFDTSMWSECHKIDQTSDKQTIQLLLVDILRLLVFYDNKINRSDSDRMLNLCNALNSIAPKYESIPLNQLQTELATKYDLVWVTDYLNQIPRLDDETQKILRDQLKAEAHSHNN